MYCSHDLCTDTLRHQVYLHAGSQLHFMDPETYEQESVDQQLFGGLHDYFVEDMQATLSSYEGQIVAGGLCLVLKRLICIEQWTRSSLHGCWLPSKACCKLCLSGVKSLGDNTCTSANACRSSVSILTCLLGMQANCRNM